MHKFNDRQRILEMLNQELDTMTDYHGTIKVLIERMKQQMQENTNDSGSDTNESGNDTGSDANESGNDSGSDANECGNDSGGDANQSDNDNSDSGGDSNQFDNDNSDSGASDRGDNIDSGSDSNQSDNDNSDSSHCDAGDNSDPLNQVNHYHTETGFINGENVKEYNKRMQELNEELTQIQKECARQNRK